MGFWNRLTGGARGIAPASYPRAVAVAAAPPYRSATIKRADWHVGDPGPQIVVDESAASIRKRARQAYRNDANARAIVDAHVGTLIGTGITPRPVTSDPKMRASFLALWNAWAERADASEVGNFYALQEQVARSAYVDGECFVRIRTRLKADAIPGDFQLEVLEAEQLDEAYNDLQQNIRAGIQFGPTGAPAVYHFWRSHPGEPTRMTIERTPVPAESVIHVFSPERPGQIRGVSRLAPVLPALLSLDRLTYAHLRRIELSNMPSTFIVNPNDDGGPFVTDSDGNTVLSPGMVPRLLPGEEVRFSTPPAPESSFAEYVRAQRRAICAGAGVPYEVAFADLGAINDRAMRAVYSDYRRRVGAEAWRLVHQLCEPVWAVLMASAAAFVIGGSAAKNTGARWSTQGFPYLHPLQDITAKLLAKAGGLTSRSALVAEGGDDIEDVDAQNKEDAAREKSLGLVYSNGNGKVVE